MFKFNLKILFRTIRNKPVYSFISIFGFTFGIAASLLIYLWVFDELSFEKFHKDYNRIYRVLTLSKQGDEIVKSASSYIPLAQTLKLDFPQIENATYLSFSSEDSPLQAEGKTDKIEARGMWTDDNFFELFQGFKFIEGNPESALKNSSDIVLSEKVAKKLFGNETALGKTLISDKYAKEVYTVSGVLRIPPQSHIDFGYILSEKQNNFVAISRSWRKSAYTHVYIKLQKNAKIDDEFRNQVSGQVGKYSSITDKLLFQPLADIHLYTDYETFNYDIKISHYKYIWIFSGLAFMIILMASLNFASITTARASERSTEIGVRKVSGSGKNHLIIQFLTESIIQTFIATILALVLVWLLLPWLGNLSGKEFTFSFSPQLLGLLFLFTFLIGIISGLYPAFYLTLFQPVLILKGGNPTGSKAGFTKILVLTQFIIALVLVVSTGTIYKQLNFIKNYDLGIEKENIVIIPTGLWYGVKDFKNELLKNPNILSVSASTAAPVDFAWLNGFTWQGMNLHDTLQASLIWADEDFASTYGLKMVKGDFLRQNYSDYWEEFNKEHASKIKGENYTVSLPVVINETAQKMMGMDDPIGLRLNNDNVIVGVVEDFNFRPLHNKIAPMVMMNNPENIMTVNVKISPKNRAETLIYIRNTFIKYRDSRGFSYSFFEDELAEKYKAEGRLGNLFLKFSLLALLIAMLGVFGLSTFATERRVKEIGIRKVNGAKLFEILTLLNKDFIKWILIAVAVATPVSWVLMDNWLQNFAYKTHLSWWIFVVAGVTVLGIALLTVSFQSWKAARRNPVEALRYE